MSESKPASVKLGHQTMFEIDGSGQFLTLAILLLIGLAACIGVGLLQWSAKPKPQYFQATSNEQILNEGALSSGYVSTSALLNWVTEAVMAGFSFNYTNYPKILQHNKLYFTQEGYQSYQQAVSEVNQSPVSIAVLQRMVLKPEPRDAPTVLLEGPADMTVEGEAGVRYAWKVQLPIYLHYHGYNQMRTDLAMVTLKVVRVPTLSSQIGVKIVEFSLQVTSQIPTGNLAVPI